MIFYFTVSIICFCSVVYFVMSNIMFYNYSKKQTDWYGFLHFILDSCYDIVYTKEVLIYIANDINMNVADAEYRKSLLLFSDQVTMKLGKLKNKVYLKYFFKNNDQFLDYLNMYLYTKIQESIVNTATIDNMLEKSNSKITDTEQYKSQLPKDKFANTQTNL